MNWRELEVRRERGRRPRRSPGARAPIALAGRRQVLLSLTHDGEYAMAQAMLIGDGADDEARRR